MMSSEVQKQVLGRGLCAFRLEDHAEISKFCFSSTDFDILHHEMSSLSMKMSIIRMHTENGLLVRVCHRQSRNGKKFDIAFMLP